jgi:hypothetical protein
MSVRPSDLGNFALTDRILWNSKWQNFSKVSREHLNFILLSYWLTYLLNYLLTPWNTVFLEKLTGLQLVKKFPAFYATRKFITPFTNARHLSLSTASPLRSILPHPTYWRSILIFFSHLHLGLPSGLFPSGLPCTRPSPYKLYVPPIS